MRTNHYMCVFVCKLMLNGYSMQSVLQYIHQKLHINIYIDKCVK